MDEDADVNKIDASDFETARNIGLEDDMFAPVEEAKDESSRLPDRMVKDNMSDQDSVIDVMNQIEEDDDDGQSHEI